MRLGMILRLIPLAVLVAAAGCRSTKAVLQDYERNIVSGNYAAAAAEPAQLAAKDDDSQLLWQLLAGSAYYLAGDDVNTVSMFNAAEERMIQNDQTSVFKQTSDSAMSMALNDKFFAYDGGGQDRIFTSLYLAQIYAAKGRRDAARNEFNYAAAQQDEWLWRRRKDLEASDERMRKDSAKYAESQSDGNKVDISKNEGAISQGLQNATFASTIRTTYGFDIFTSGILDKLKPADFQNPYASHLIGIFRTLDRVGGRNHLKDAATLRPDNPYAVADLKMVDSGKTPKNMVWVYIEDGLGPYRDEWRVDYPLFLIPYANQYIKYAGICLPRLNARQVAANWWTVNGKRAYELANVDALAKIEYDVYMRGAIAREITRTLVDAAIQVGLGIAANNVSDSRARMALKLSQVAAAAYSYVRRGADTRSWTALPKRVLLVRLPRPENGVLEVMGDAMPIARIDLPMGNSLVFIKKPAMQAPASVRVIGGM